MSAWHWTVWLRGLISGAVSGASTGVAAMLAVPEVANTVHPGAVLKIAAIGALVGLANYLRQSPLPSDDQLVQGSSGRVTYPDSTPREKP